jgi:predicted regulator of Ras-like GTPase activity (Roadblock/LC7/MglB family)
MNFKEGLERIAAKVDDFIGVAIVDADGISIEEHKKDPQFDFNPLIAEFSAFLKAADKASISAEVGPSDEVTVSAEKATVIIKRIKEGYFLLLATDSRRNIGKGRFFVGRESALISEDL